MTLPVLIVGAGPTGLMMACELARHGVPFRIIDKKSEPTKTTNAVWIQPRTLEIFEQIGIIHRFIQEGHPCRAIKFYSNGKQIAFASLDVIDSLYTYAIMAPQSLTERVLIDRLAELNHQVERSSELTSLYQSASQVEAIVKQEDGRSETITCDWLIACDGANSTVRELCHIPFPGGELSQQFMVADAKMDSYLRADEVHVFNNNGTMFAAFPFGDNRFRLGANLHFDHPRKLFTEKEVKDMVIERAHGLFNVESVSWISPFWIHSKIAEKMREDHVFLAGDAAHVHSPVGGQGMNSGLQDAYNLAWKLAMVIQQGAKPSLLDSYQAERYIIAKNIVNLSDRFTRLMLIENRWFTALRDIATRLIFKIPYLMRFIMNRLTQLSQQYRSSPIIDYSAKVSGPRPGQHAPNAALSASSRFYDFFRGTKHKIFIFSGKEITDTLLDKLKLLQANMKAEFSANAEVYLVSGNNDEHHLLHQRYQIKQPSVYVIRPDGYIALVTATLDRGVIRQFFQQY